MQKTRQRISVWLRQRLSRAAENYRRWKLEEAAYRELSGLDAHLLRDLGFDPHRLREDLRDSFRRRDADERERSGFQAPATEDASREQEACVARPCRSCC